MTADPKTTALKQIRIPIVQVLAFVVLTQVSSHAQTTPGTGSASPADTAMMAGMAKMSSNMKSAPMNGDPDHDFVVLMMPHHRGAVNMAQVELQYGKDPAMRKLARDIIAAQKKEIGEMERWQQQHSSR